MTALGKAHVMRRLSRCENLSDLRRVWGNIAVAYQKDAEILARKEALKGQLVERRAA